jgi:hypothetical protein
MLLDLRLQLIPTHQIARFVDNSGVYKCSDGRNDRPETKEKNAKG